MTNDFVWFLVWFMYSFSDAMWERPQQSPFYEFEQVNIVASFCTVKVHFFFIAHMFVFCIYVFVAYNAPKRVCSWAMQYVQRSKLQLWRKSWIFIDFMHMLWITWCTRLLLEWKKRFHMQWLWTTIKETTQIRRDYWYGYDWIWTTNGIAIEEATKNCQNHRPNRYEW